MSSVSNKARRTLPKLSKELASAVTAAGPRPATTLVTPSARPTQDPLQQTLHTSSSSSSPSGTAVQPPLREEQIAAVVREAGFAPQVAATLAAVCAYAPLQEALWESIQFNYEHNSLGLAEGVMSSIAKGSDGEQAEKGKEREESGSNCPASLGDFDHYKLKTHSFNEYRSEQDITGLLQVDDDLTGISTDGWSETSIAADARCCEDVREEERGHVGEPGAVDEDSQMFGVVLFMAVTVLSLGFLYVKDREVYRTALRSEMVKAAVALSQAYGGVLFTSVVSWAL